MPNDFTPAATQDNDVRGALTAAVSAAASSSPDPVSPSPSPSPDPVSPTPAGATSVPEIGTPGEVHPSGDGRMRDALGRFTKKDGEIIPAPAPKADATGTAPDAKATVDAAKTTADAAQAEANKKALRAPQSWNAEEREGWASLNTKQQQAVLRRETEMQRTLQATNGARQFTERMSSALNPYLGLIQTSFGGDPYSFVTGLAQAAQVLRHGSAHEKAQFVHHMIVSNGVDIPMLDGLLVGQPPQQQAQNGFDPTQIANIVKQQLQPMQQFMGSLQQRQQQTLQRVENEEQDSLQAFASDSSNEFFEDVREIMADLIDTQAARGLDMSYADAYTAACQLHPQVKAVIMGRQQQETAANLTAKARAAQAASASITGSSGTGSPGGQNLTPESDDIRASLLASVRQHGVVI